MKLRMSLSLVIIDKNGNVPYSFSADSGDYVDETFCREITTRVKGLISNISYSYIRLFRAETGILVFDIDENSIIYCVHIYSNSLLSIANHFLVKAKNYLKKFLNYCNSVENEILQLQKLEITKHLIAMYQCLYEVDKKRPGLLTDLEFSTPFELIQQFNSQLDSLIRDFPRTTVAFFRKWDNSNLVHFTNKGRMFFAIGKALGNALMSRQSSDPNDVNWLLNRMSIAKFSLKDGWHSISICPFCRSKKSKNPICDFLTGFIEGSYRNPKIKVVETDCIARGDRECKFEVFLDPQLGLLGKNPISALNDINSPHLIARLDGKVLFYNSSFSNLLKIKLKISKDLFLPTEVFFSGEQPSSKEFYQLLKNQELPQPCRLTLRLGKKKVSYQLIHKSLQRISGEISAIHANLIPSISAPVKKLKLESDLGILLIGWDDSVGPMAVSQINIPKKANPAKLAFSSFMSVVSLFGENQEVMPKTFVELPLFYLNKKAKIFFDYWPDQNMRAKKQIYAIMLIATSFEGISEEDLLQKVQSFSKRMQEEKEWGEVEKLQKKIIVQS